MSSLDEVWAALDYLQDKRNRYAHGVRDGNARKTIGSKSLATLVEFFEQVLTTDDYLSHSAFFTLQGHVSPRPLADFVAELATKTNPQSVYDPVCGGGLLLRAVAEATGAERVYGLEKSDLAARIAQAVVGELASVQVGDVFFEPESINETYDLIVADCPMGMKLHKQQADELGLTAASARLSHAMMLLATSKLNKNGVALVTVEPSFFFSKSSKKILSRLSEQGFMIDAAIHIPRHLRRDMAFDSYLLSIKLGDQGRMFVGQLSRKSEHNSQLLEGYHRDKFTDNPALGRRCDLAEFLGYDSLVARENLSRLAKKSGWASLQTSEVFNHLEVVNSRTEELKLPDDSNSLYLKLVGKGRASTKSDDLRTGSGNNLREVVHLKVNRDYADVDYLAYWFNQSRVGRLFLETLSVGETIPRIDRDKFLNTKMFLPPVDQQKKVIEGVTYLNRLRAEAEELESALSEGAASVDELVDRIHAINREDHYHDWIDTLPFPLASILWRHHASQDSYRARYEVLLHFFEATAAFLATIHLSAFMSNEEAWDSVRGGLQKRLREQSLSLDRPTFGAWKLVAELLSSSCESALNGDRGDQWEWQDLYGTADQRIVEMLCDRRLKLLLQTANKVRNDWHGHSGAVSEETARSVHEQLFDLVQQVRGIFGRVWERYELIQPGTGAYRDGLHHISCHRLMGTRSAPFEDRVYTSLQPLEADRLYLFDSVKQTGMKIGPLIEVIPSPKKQANACFIFNRLEQDGARWVSYHFEQESEISHPSAAVHEWLDRINRVDD